MIVTVPGTDNQLLAAFDRLGATTDVGNHAAHDTHFYAFGNFNFDVVGVIGNLGNFSHQATVGDDLISAANGRNHFTMLAGALLLGPQNQKIYNNEYQDEWNYLEQETPAVS